MYPLVEADRHGCARGGIFVGLKSTLRKMTFNANLFENKNPSARCTYYRHQKKKMDTIPTNLSYILKIFLEGKKMEMC